MADDFPAAHSMDTTWFAVDRDGHVACFNSGEAGAVPLTAFAGDEAYEMCERLAQLLPRGPVAYDLTGRQVPGPEGAEVWHQAQEGGRGYPVLLFLKTLDAVREALASGQAVQVPGGDRLAVTFQRLPPEVSRRIHEAGACLACYTLYGGSEEAFDPASHGLFEYEHLTDNWISGPYGCHARPVKPLHVDQLPPDVRDLVKQMRFDNLSFAQTTHLQPLEHTDCASWEAAWMDVTGKRVRPVPGREEDYADAVGELDHLADEGVEIEPPPGAEEED